VSGAPSSSWMLWQRPGLNLQSLVSVWESGTVWKSHRNSSCSAESHQPGRSLYLFSGQRKSWTLGGRHAEGLLSSKAGLKLVPLTLFLVFVSHLFLKTTLSIVARGYWAEV
jgi:hypothetical protein